MATITEKLVLQYQAEVAAANKKLAALDKKTEKLNKRFKNAQKVSKNFQKNLNTFRSAALPAIAAIAALSAGVGSLVSAYGQQEKAEAKLRGALQATGNAVGLTKDQLIEYAKELQRTTEFGDEAVIEAESIFLTFTKIGKQAFPDAIKAAADMSVMFGQDLKQSAIQLGTALNDPVAGIGRLRRIGVSFTEDQKESIKQFVAQNDIMSAQRIILEELQNEFGGVSKEVAKVGTGPIKQFANSVGDLAEAMGGALIPIINNTIGVIGPFIVRLTDIVRGQTELERSTQLIKAATTDYTEAVRLLTTESDKLTETQKNLLSAQKDLARADILAQIGKASKAYNKNEKTLAKLGEQLDYVRDKSKFFRMELGNITKDVEATAKRYYQGETLSQIAARIQSATVGVKGALRGLSEEESKLLAKQAKLTEERENYLAVIAEAYNQQIISTQDLTGVNDELRNKILERAKESQKALEDERKVQQKNITLTEDQIKIQEEFRRSQLTDTQRQLEDIAKEYEKFVAAGVDKNKAWAYYQSERTRILREAEEERFKIEKDKKDRIAELNKASDEAFAAAAQAKLDAEQERLNQEEENNKRTQEKIREEYLKTKDIVVDAALSFASTFVSQIKASESVWTAFRKAGQDAVASVIEVFAKQYDVLAAAALVPGPTFNPVAAGGYFALSTAAKVAANTIRALEYGGRFTTNQPTPILVGDNSSRTETVQVTPSGGGTANNETDLPVNVVINLDGSKLSQFVTKATRNRQIIIDQGAIV